MPFALAVQLRKGDYRSTQTGPSDPRSYHHAIGAEIGNRRPIYAPIPLDTVRGRSRVELYVPLRRRGTRAGALSCEVLRDVTPTLWYRSQANEGIRSRHHPAPPEGSWLRGIHPRLPHSKPRRRASLGCGSSWYQGCNRGVGGRGTGKARSAWAIGFMGTQPIMVYPPRPSCERSISGAPREELRRAGAHPDSHAPEPDCRSVS